MAAALLALPVAAVAEPVEIAAMAAGWPERWVLTGTKTEPTWVGHVRLSRDGDRFLLEGGAPLGETPSREAMQLGNDGTLHRTLCPPGMAVCDDDAPPAGFLASAAILGAIRSGRLDGRFEPRPYGTIEIVCIPAETIGIADPVLDPCVETGSGAVVAQRHRLSGAFAGPSLDPWSVAIAVDPGTGPPTSP